MAELGITFSQLGIGANTYSGLRALTPPPQSKNRIVHAAANVTTFPTKDLGYVPSKIVATLLVTALSVDDLVADVLNGTTERKISFMLGALEHYCYAYAGDVTSLNCVNEYGSATRQYDVSVSFPLSRSGVYLASSDAVQWGA